MEMLSSDILFVNVKCLSIPAILLMK